MLLNDRALPERHDAEASFRLPQNAGARVALVKTLMSSFKNEHSFLVWFDAWSVWPSGERMHIFDRFRLSYGEHRALAEAPANLITKDAYEEAVSLVVLGVFFLWDCYVITPQREKLLFLSHDEFGQTWGLPASS